MLPPRGLLAPCLQALGAGGRQAALPHRGRREGEREGGREEELFVRIASADVPGSVEHH